jgi:Lrp/AsnC family transcriptional regulator for asnA, asnC and gidA
MSQNNSVDATDRKIVAELRKNGRASNQQIADALSLTATTVSSRIKRMEEADMLRVVAVSDFAAHGFNFLMRVAVEVEGRPTSDVAKDLAQFPEVFATHIVTGRHDVDLLVALKEFDDLSKLMLDDFAKVKGIRAMTPSVVVDVIKYQFDVAPISERG